MKLTATLIDRLNNELSLDIPLTTTVKHLNPTINQQSRGMFKWVFEGNAFNKYGSTQGIRELCKSKKLHLSYSTSGGLSTLPRSLIDILGD